MIVDLVPAVAVGEQTNGVLDYAIYQGAWPWVPDFDALNPIAKGKTAGLDVSVAAQKNNFGVSLKGYVRVPADGQYTFYLADDSGAQLWLHEVHLIDDDFNQLHRGEVSAAIFL